MKKVLYAVVIFTIISLSTNVYAQNKEGESECFNGVDYSSARNDYGGFYNAPNNPNELAFAALKQDGSIVAWGNPNYGGANAPTDKGYVKIYSTANSFAALKSDGTISTWGGYYSENTNIPIGEGYTEIYSTGSAFAALKQDGSIVAWGNPNYGGANAPTDKGYVKIYSTANSFAALKQDGSIVAWGDNDSGGAGAPTDKGYVKIYSTSSAFAALKQDGSITSWGSLYFGGTGAPTDSGYIEVYSTDYAFAALKQDGSIVAWGIGCDSGVPTDKGYTKIYSTDSVFAALKSDGSIVSWGFFENGNSFEAPTDKGYEKIYSTYAAFAALKSDGSITVWGDSDYGGSNAPTDKGYIKIYSTKFGAFAALKSDGSITVWGGGDSSLGAPTDPGYIIPYGGDTCEILKFSQCNDSIDNDGNGLIDYPNDPGCVNMDDNEENGFMPIFRLYNTRNGAQLYTRGVADKDKILAKFKDFEFTDGQPAFWASLTEQPGLTPIFRLYNQRTGAQLYTRGEADKNKILNKFKDFKFTDGTPAFYASLIDDGSTPIYRLYNRRTGMQLYTRGKADKDKILAKFKDFEFTDDGPAFYLRTN